MKKILIVEDNEENRILIRDILQHFGYEAIEAKNGEEGIRIAKEHKPVLTLMDIQMPVLDGLSAIKALRADPETKNMKIIALTSFSMKGDREKAIEAGADEYMSKPINTRKLMKVIERILGEEEKGGSEER